MTNFPPVFSVAQSGNFSKLDPAEYDGDPRGLLWMWEPPVKSATYAMGIDVAYGRTGWNRYNRSKRDKDNGAIEVFRIGKMGAPDMQVAEYVAPVDPFELGDIANLMGRLYSGTEEDQCRVIGESTPGPGFGTLQRMLELGYTNHFIWEYFADGPAQQSGTRSMWWSASPRNNRALWVKSSSHLNRRSVIIRSPWLTEEYADCRMDPEKEWAENKSGRDDRVRAANLAIWMANGWSLNIERTAETVRTAPANFDPQASDMTLEEINEHYNSLIDRAYN